MKVTKESRVPLFGLDFIGIIDRGTNLIEIKPTTVCNLECGYCYANSGHYTNNFQIEPNYLIGELEHALSVKEEDDNEVHIDPYGEAMLHPNINSIIASIAQMDKVRKISMQTNGTLLSEKNLEDLHNAGLNQLNITLNAIGESLAKKLACKDHYEPKFVMKAIIKALHLGFDVVITPVWFFKVNDSEIEKIIEFYASLKKKLENPEQLQLGIQNYLEYKTGRRIKKTREREFSYFYKRLRDLEKKHGEKLLMGPSDFSIHPAPIYQSRILEYLFTADNDSRQKIEIEILSQGRFENEFIGAIDGWGVKVLNFTGLPIDIAQTNVVTVPLSRTKIKSTMITAYLK